MLTSYHQTRLLCMNCGTFEQGTRDRIEGNETCPWCDGALSVVATCRGMTSRPLPWTTDPSREEPIPQTSLDVINNTVSDTKPRRHANGKSTGRRKGGEGRKVYRGPSDQMDTQTADQQRYQQQKKERMSRDVGGPSSASDRTGVDFSTPVETEP